jgi:hypothetical protein
MIFKFLFVVAARTFFAPNKRSHYGSFRKFCFGISFPMGSINFCFPVFPEKEIAAIKVNMRLKGHVL